jgi:hypothetical protein
VLPARCSPPTALNALGHACCAGQIARVALLLCLVPRLVNVASCNARTPCPHVAPRIQGKKRGFSVRFGPGGGGAGLGAPRSVPCALLPFAFACSVYVSSDAKRPTYLHLGLYMLVFNAAYAAPAGACQPTAATAITSCYGIASYLAAMPLALPGWYLLAVAA